MAPHFLSSGALLADTTSTEYTSIDLADGRQDIDGVYGRSYGYATPSTSEFHRRSVEDGQDVVVYDSANRSLPHLHHMQRDEESTRDEHPSTRKKSATDGPPTLNIPVYHEILFIGVVVMAQFMSLAGLGQAIAPLSYILEDLSATYPGSQAWIVAAYSLTVGTFILMSGRMGDILGYKRIFNLGYGFLGVWAVIVGFSAYTGHLVMFVVCRGFQGVGAGILTPNALAVLGRAYPNGSLKKNLSFALFGAMVRNIRT